MPPPASVRLRADPADGPRRRAPPEPARITVLSEVTRRVIGNGRMGLRSGGIPITARSGWKPSITWRAVTVANGQVGIVGEHCSRADQDGVRSRPETVHLGAGLPGEVIHWLVRRRRRCGRRASPRTSGHERKSGFDGERHSGLTACASLARDTTFDGDTGRSKCLSTRPGPLDHIGLRVDDPDDSRIPQRRRAWSGPADVVARSRVTTAVQPRSRSPAAAMPDSACGVTGARW